MPDDEIRLPDVQSAEHRRALRERGVPRGSHIKETSEETRPNLDPSTSIAIALADLRDEQRAFRAANAAGQTPAPTPAPAKSWATTPVIIGMTVGLISIVGSAATTLQGYTQLGDRLSSFGERMISLDGRTSLLEKEFQARGQSRDKEVSTLAAKDTLQDERLQNITKALEQERQARIEAEADQRRSSADQRGIVNDLTKTLGDLRSDLKVLVDRAQRHARVDDGQRDDGVIGPRISPR